MRSLPIIKIDKTCIKCNKCVDICPRYIFFPSKNEIKLRDLETCNDCGHCIAICPVDAIYHNRLIKDSVEAEYPLANEHFNYDQTLMLIRQRRSIRYFSDKTLSKEQILRLIQFGRYAPTGHNARKVNYTIVMGREKVVTILSEVIEAFKKIREQVTKPILRFLALLIGKRKKVEKVRRSLYRLNSHITYWEAKIDKVFHNASSLILIHADENMPSPFEDCVIAAENIMLGAQSIELGATYIGYLVKAWEHSKDVRELINLPINHSLYAVLAVGKPNHNFKRVVSRPEPKLIYWNSKT